MLSVFKQVLISLVEVVMKKIIMCLGLAACLLAVAPGFAKSHRRSSHHSRTSWSFNFGLGVAPQCVEYRYVPVYPSPVVVAPPMHGYYQVYAHPYYAPPTVVVPAPSPVYVYPTQRY